MRFHNPTHTYSQGEHPKYIQKQLGQQQHKCDDGYLWASNGNSEPESWSKIGQNHLGSIEKMAQSEITLQ
jgi:hypothetical protein